MESVFRLSSMLEPARDLTIDAASAIGLAKSLRAGSSSRTLSAAKLKALLDGRSDRDILDGLRRVVSMIYQDKSCLPYFSSVVKNVANPNIEIKKLVYIYLLHYAELDPDLALLSVNAIQKSLSDQNPQVRALALRTMAGMRVPVISQIVSLAIKRGVSDMSPHVRKAAALAIPKCYRLDPHTQPQLLEYLSTLIGDKQYFVAGPAIQAFLTICPERIDLIHKHYRGLVKKLVDMDEWSQIATLRLLLFYSRRCFPHKTRRVTTVTKKGFYEDEQNEVTETGEEVVYLDPDLELLLKACKQLLLSRNAAVTISVASCYLYLGTPDYLKEAVGPLVALTRDSSEIQEAAILNLMPIALNYPTMIVPYASHFFITTNDSSQIWRLKLELLSLIYPHAATHLKSIILSELEHFSHSSDVEFTQESVRAIGRCARTDPSSAARCFKILLSKIGSFNNVLVSEVLTVMRHLIQQNPDAHRKTIVRLARHLDQTKSPEARSTIIWLVGEFAAQDADRGIAADVLRILTKGFADESEPAKQQIVLLAAKVYLHWLQGQAEQSRPQSEYTEIGDGKGESAPSNGFDQSHPVPQLWSYILLLARYDTSYDLRDRARLFKALLSNPSSTQLASLLLLAPKPVPQSVSPSESRKDLMLGSSTLMLGKDVAGSNGLPGYENVPDWVEAGNEPDPRLRDSDTVLEAEEYGAKKPLVAASQRLDDAVREQGLEKVVQAGRAKTLDDWLEDDEEEETETDEEASEEDSEEEESEEEEESGEHEDEQGEAQENQGLMQHTRS